MYPWLLVGIGGFIGAVLRFFMSSWVQERSGVFPLGTLVVNGLGCALLGFVLYLSEFSNIVSEDTRTFLTWGIFGAFTTMSTFSSESISLFEKKEILLFMLYVGGTIIVCFGSIFLGRSIGVLALGK